MRRFRRLIPELALVAACADPGAARDDEARSGIVVAASIAAPVASPSASAVGKNVLAPIARRLRDLEKSRYMEGSCRRGSYPGWEGFPLKRCRYSVPGGKSAEVILLNPSARKLTRWIESACRDRGAACLEALTERIVVQSGAQYPVAGIVLEDIRPGDGAYEMYCFRHGVRVEVEGFATLSTARPTEEDQRACLEGKLERPTAFARIAGTTVAQYLAAGGTLAVGSDAAPTAAWLEASRTLYQRAWKRRDNALLDAWVKATFGEPKQRATTGSG
jgi:hypothetical protein